MRPGTQIKIGDIPGVKPVYRRAGKSYVRLTPTNHVPVRIERNSLEFDGPVEVLDPEEVVEIIHC